jgi:phosphoglycolate phosphatase
VSPASLGSNPSNPKPLRDCLKKVLLFDIDGTLVRSDSALGNLHHAAFIYGFKEVYGVKVSDEVLSYAGITDKFEVRDILRKKGIDDDKISEHMDEMFHAMTQYFSKNIVEADYRDSIIENVAQTLGQLSKSKELILGLLTGNVKDIAEMKMRALGISNYFKIGAYGDSSENRTDLVDMAIADAVKQRLLEKIDKKQVYVIGDTKYDITCAKESGAVSVAVATGNSSKSDLEVYEPDYLLSKLAELTKVINTK